MKTILRKRTLFLLTLMGGINSCDITNVAPIANTAPLPARLSDYGIFQNGDIGQPDAEFYPYDLSTQLFTDYAEKRRLLHLPRGTQFTFDQTGNPIFPDSSVLVKTFFYYHDKRNPAAGRQLIETRILMKVQGQWNVGTYVWNEDQTDAILTDGGLDKTVTWTNEAGARTSIRYRVPSRDDCSGCHRSDRSIIPIGPKARNLNIPLPSHPGHENQLLHFQKMGILVPGSADLQTALPDWQNPSHMLEQRARAYLDVNCAHCHSSQGLAQNTRLFFDYALSYADTRIHANRNDILHRIETTNNNIRMPRLGTTVHDSAGVALIKAYIESL